VVEDAQSIRRVVISSSESDRVALRPSVEALRQSDEIVVRSTGDHAEINIMNYAKENNLKLIAVGAGKPYCLECGPALDADGVLATGPRKSRK
jgi:hypothetical protein